MGQQFPVRKMACDFFKALFNIAVFLPYFFSVPTLLKTLFAPWKNLTAAPSKKQRSLSQWGSDISFNLVSRFMGFMMRSSLLVFFGLTMALFIFLIPFIAAVFFLTLPLTVFLGSFTKPEAQRKQELLTAFVNRHVLRTEDLEEGNKWFEIWYSRYGKKGEWWELANLFSLPPLARDWVAGYTPTLDDYTDELTSSIYQGSRFHLVGRAKELQEIERALSKSDEANIIISGENGVGKHTIVDAFAKKIYEGQTNVLLMYKRVVKLNMEKILNLSTDSKKREETLNELFNEAATAGNIILVIENFDRYISAGTDRVDLTSSIEKYARLPNLHFLGITTPSAYQRYMENNPVIARLFTKIEVREITKPEAYGILLQAALLFEDRHHLTIPYETVSESVEKSEHFITNVPFPEKALQLLDEACILAAQKDSRIVMPEFVDQILRDKTHIPVVLSADLKVKLLQLEALLRRQIINQEQAVEEVASGLRRAFLLMGERKKPLAGFLFLGPTGVGKTETAKAIARVLFESDANLIRFDMSEYQNREDIPKLIGPADGSSPGLLTAALREHPYGVLLLDELEKADHDLLNIFLTVLDEGYFTDGIGKRIDCKNLIIIATSNAGAELMYERQKEQPDIIPKQEEVVDYLIKNRVYTPEFLNRFDGVVVYQPLSGTAPLAVARSLLSQVEEQIFKLYKVRLTVSESTLADIVGKNFNPAFGARNLERALRTTLEDTVAKKILSNEVQEGGSISL